MEVEDGIAELKGMSRGARGRQWPGWCLSVAKVALGPCEREGEQRRGEARERVRERLGLRGIAREAQGDDGEAAGSRRWPGRVRARVGHAPSSWQGEEDDRGGGGGLGRHRARPGGLHSR